MTAYRPVQTSRNTYALAEVSQYAKLYLFDDILIVSFRSYSRLNIAEMLLVFVPPIFFGYGPKFLSEFYKSGSASKMCQSLVTIDRATSEIIGGEKRKEESVYKRVQQNRMAGSVSIATGRT